MGISHLGKANQNELMSIKKLIEAGRVKPHIDRCYKLSEVAQALKYYEMATPREKL